MRASALGRARAVNGVEASQYFSAQRRLLLQDLAANTHDRSLAGRVDPLIAPLVSFINGNLEQYVTTSSCSGRLALFHRGKTADAVAPSQDAPQNIEGSRSSSSERKRGGFGRGTLFQTHDPLPDAGATARDVLVPTLRSFQRWRQQMPTDAPLTLQTELLQLKFEPMILHVLCRDVDAAAALLQCCSEAAQGNSGLISCSRGTQQHRKIVCCVTSPVAMDVPLFSEGRWLLPVEEDSGGFSSPTWVSLLEYAVSRANALFAENTTRMDRLSATLRQRLLPP